MYIYLYVYMYVYNISLSLGPGILGLAGSGANANQQTSVEELLAFIEGDEGEGGRSQLLGGGARLYRLVRWWGRRRQIYRQKRKEKNQKTSELNSRKLRLESKCRFTVFYLYVHFETFLHM